MPDPQFRGTFSVPQTKQLLAAINPRRVLKDPRGNSHVSQQDVTAHLIRVFGFGNFATELLGCEMIYETVRQETQEGQYTVRKNGKAEEHDAAKNPQVWKYDVAYRASMRITIFDQNHNYVASYEDASVGDAQNQTRADAHDLAMKSAISLAKKRACINLGDQFGLSLYNKGQESALVIGTHVLPPKFDEGQETKEGKDLQSEVPKQESMGTDEIEVKPEATDEQEALLAEKLGASPVEETP